MGQRAKPPKAECLFVLSQPEESFNCPKINFLCKTKNFVRGAMAVLAPGSIGLWIGHKLSNICYAEYI